MSLMGIDVGTTGVKAVVFDESGKQLSSAYEEYPLLFPFAGACELDSARVMDAALRVIAQAAAQVNGSDPVTAVGIASQGEAFTPIDVHGRMLANAMTSSDARAESLVQAWSEDFGGERLYRITGHTAYPMFSLFKLLWLKQNQPQVWERTWKFLFFQDLLAHVLTGETKTDHSMAARSMMFDVRKKSWSPEILDAAGLSTDRLPEVVPSGEIAGQVMSSLCGLGPNVTVSVAGHDQPVGALGCGAAGAGMAAYSIGTVECICASADHLVLSPELMKANLAIYPHVLPNLYTTVAFNVTGGSVVKWVRDNFATEEAAQAVREGVDPYDRIVAAASAEPAKVVLLPHFGPTGTPHFDPHGAGVLFGLKLSTERSEVIRAVLEGITYEMKWNADILQQSGFPLKELRAVGGGAKSETWMQIKADIMGIPLTTMRVTEATCMGAALLAGHGAGILDADVEWAEPIRTFEPSDQYAGICEESFAIYKELYQSLGKARLMLNKRSLS